MNVTSGVNAQTPLLPPSERGNDEKPVAEIVEFNAYGNKPRCLICVGTTALFTSLQVFSVGYAQGLSPVSVVVRHILPL